MKTTTYTACPCGNPDHWSADNPFGPELVRHRLAIDDHDVDGDGSDTPSPLNRSENTPLPRYGF